MSEASEASAFEANESEASDSEASETRMKPKASWDCDLHLPLLSHVAVVLYGNYTEDFGSCYCVNTNNLVGCSANLFQVEFTADGQATRQYRAKYATVVGQVARTHCPPMYKDWAEVPVLTKDELWKDVLVYDMYPTDAERKRNGPKKVKKEEWEAFVDMCSTEEDKIKRCNGKLARENMKNPYTTGRMGATPVIEQLKKDSPTGEVSRTQGYVATHTRRDGSFINTETRQSLEEINRLVSVEPDIVEKDLDNDPAAMVIGRDGRGRVCGLGGGVTKTVYHASSPYKEIAQREKRARESNLKRQSSGLGNASQLGRSGWRFTKFSRIDYVRWKAANRIVPGVNAKLLGCQEP
ncbi:hypothetical protein IFM89_027724 [Coptis chinensis]|uniref:Uncharacterized protein n=1 Tax=Coptis chinensis TaxID=261450 RepID=A0A835HTJ2_9MAGN|nr:hypothetical protein IFM89_027724 [Coptis chinensis]